MQYFITKKHCIAVNSKVLSNAIAYGALKRDFPEEFQRGSTLRFDPDNEAPIYFYRNYLEQTDKPELPVIVGLREPIARFLSAVAMNNTPIDEVIISLTKKRGAWHNHALFEKQIGYRDDTHGQPITYFKLPGQIEELCTFAGFEFPLPVLNESQNPNPVLTADQREALEAYYADDIAFYESV